MFYFLGLGFDYEISGKTDNADAKVEELKKDCSVLRIQVWKSGETPVVNIVRDLSENWVNV